MKQKKNIQLKQLPMARLLLLTVCIPAFFAACEGVPDDIITELAEIDYPDGTMRDDERELLVAKIKKHRKTAEAVVHAVSQTGVLHKNQGDQYIKLQKYGDARASFLEALYLQPVNTILFERIAFCLRKESEGMLASAREDMLLRAERSYLRALELAPGNVKALEGLARLYIYDLKTPRKAQPLLEALSDVELPPEMEIINGEELEKRERERAAEYILELEEDIEQYSKTAQTRPEDSQYPDMYHKLQAIYYLKLEMYNKAKTAIEKALLIDNDNDELFVRLAICEATLAKSALNRNEAIRLYTQAAESYESALSLDGDDVDALYGLAILYSFEIPDREEAVTLLHRLLEKDANHFRARFVLARTYYSQGRFASALGQYDKIIQLTDDPVEREQAEALRLQLKQEADL